jgi:putative pyruvate formate lyase activating enzyme
MKELLKNCKICPRGCGANRFISKGACGAGSEIMAAKAFLHQWEEPCISGTHGSGTIFFSGCNMKCVFCQNHDISQQGFGKAITVERLAEIMLELQNKGASNINLVTPTPYALHIIEAVALAKRHGLALPIVYNTNGYETAEMIEMLKDTVDIYLPDIKYFSPVYSSRYSGVSDYFAVASKAVLSMYNQAGYPEFDEAGMLTKGLLIRHLALPGLTEDSSQIFKWIRESIGKYAYVSLMCQYTPMYKAFSFEEIDRKLSSEEYERVIESFFEAGLENGFMQEAESATSRYTPVFDLLGIEK